MIAQKFKQITMKKFVVIYYTTIFLNYEKYT